MENRTTPEEAVALLRRIFPDGLTDSGVLASLCPAGWQESPLYAAFHPPPEALYEELLNIRETAKSVFGKSSRREPPPECDPPSFEEFVDGFPFEEAVPGNEEAGRLTGLCLWDIFSDNNEVLLPDGRTAHLGSFRGCAGELADFFYGRQTPEPVLPADFMSLNMDYMEFYLGSRVISRRASLRPVYRFIFARLKEAGCDWRYSFTATPSGVARQGEGHLQSAATFGPAEAQGDDEAEFLLAENELDECSRRALDKAMFGPPPETVAAYHEVYGRFPAGWPPWEPET